MVGWAGDSGQRAGPEGTGGARAAGLGRHHAQPERPTRGANRFIKAEKGEIRDRRSGDHGAGQVKRVEGTNRLTREGAAGAVDDLTLDPHEIPVSGRLREAPAEPECVGRRECARRLPSDQDAVALDERQVRGHDELGSGKGAPNGIAPRFAEQPAEDRAGFGVDVQRSSRSSSRSRWSSVGLSRLGMRR